MNRAELKEIKRLLPMLLLNLEGQEYVEVNGIKVGIRETVNR